MTIKAGDKMPAGVFKHITPEGPKEKWVPRTNGRKAV